MNNCQRCGCPAQGQPTNKPDAKMLRRAVKGVCVDCGVTLFIQRLNNAHGGHMLIGGTESLRLPHFQRQFVAVMKAGDAEANSDEINWERVIANWDVAPAASDSMF